MKKNPKLEERRKKMIIRSVKIEVKPDKIILKNENTQNK